MIYVWLLLLYFATLIALLKHIECKNEKHTIDIDEEPKEINKKCVKGVNEEDKKISVTESNKGQIEIDNWDQLAQNICPNCKAKGKLDIFAEAGIAFNALCHECRVVWWMTPEREFGAKIVDKR